MSNKTINGKQFKFYLYVGSNKINQKYPKVGTDIIDIIKENIGDLTVYRGKSTLS